MYIVRKLCSTGRRQSPALELDLTQFQRFGLLFKEVLSNFPFPTNYTVKTEFQMIYK